MSPRRRAFALAQFAFGLLVLAGSTFEVVNLLVPSLFVTIQDNPLMRMHHANRIVFYWTLLSNIVTAGLAATLILGAVGTMKGRTRASETSRRAIAAFFIVLGGSAAISFVYLVPPLMAMLKSRGDHAMALTLLVSVGGSLLGLAFMLACLFAGHDRILRNQAAAPDAPAERAERGDGVAS